MMKKINKKYFLCAALALAVMAVSAFVFWDNIGAAYRAATKKADKNGIYKVDDYYAEALGEVNEKSVSGFCKKLNGIKAEYLTDKNKVFYAIVPDKGFYLQNSGYPTTDYAKMFSLTQKGLEGFTQIELTDKLSLSDYYKTDSHWRQEKLGEVVTTIGSAMGFSVDISAFTQNSSEDFIGSFAKSIVGKAPKESLVYLTDATTDAATADNYQQPDFHKIYDVSRLDSKLPYDVFLSGATPVVTITNPLAQTEKSLVVFRDSYASSLAPLLLGGYKTVTLIDLRYMSAPLIKDFISFDNQDVLFLYSTWVINNSAVLR
ncbi:MAG: DHHW family protein [Oscillospiraceae bacterium]